MRRHFPIFAESKRARSYSTSLSRGGAHESASDRDHRQTERPSRPLPAMHAAVVSLYAWCMELGVRRVVDHKRRHGARREPDYGGGLGNPVALAPGGFFSAGGEKRKHTSG